jgi:polysaccharide export outer membrane protein
MKRASGLLIVILLVCGSAEALAASVTLAWDGVPGLRYMVFYGTKSGVYTRSVDANDRHSIVIDGLADNQVYYFAVRAYDTRGQMSGFSKEVRKITAQTPPAEPKAAVAHVPMTPPADRKDAGTLVSVSPPAERKETAAPAEVMPPADRKAPGKETSTSASTVPVQTAVPRPVATTEVVPSASGVGSNGSASASAAPAPRPDRIPPPVPATVSEPPGYLIGPNDVLSVTFWRDKEMNADAVVVRPDGNITLPLLNDIQAAGLTPAQLRDRILAEAQRYIEDPSPTVAVKEIRSRNVFITGQVDKPGPYPLAGPMTVLQLIAMAGGLKEFADGKNIVVMRAENGRQVAYQVDYKELLKRKNLRQNIDLKPGDTVVVP